MCHSSGRLTALRNASSFARTASLNPFRGNSSVLNVFWPAEKASSTVCTALKRNLRGYTALPPPASSWSFRSPVVAGWLVAHREGDATRNIDQASGRRDTRARLVSMSGAETKTRAKVSDRPWSDEPRSKRRSSRPIGRSYTSSDTFCQSVLPDRPSKNANMKSSGLKTERSMIGRRGRKFALPPLRSRLRYVCPSRHARSAPSFSLLSLT